MKKADKYILISIAIVVLISSIGIYLYRILFSTPGTIAIITQDGKVIRTIDLDKVTEPYDFTIQTNDGEYNTIHVENKTIRFSDANCPDQLCVKKGNLSNTDDIAVCLPHRLLIEIKGDVENEIDSLSH